MEKLVPFLITGVLSSHNYQLILPENLKSIHPAFYTSLLGSDLNNPIQGKMNMPNSSIQVDNSGEDLQEVDAFVGFSFQYRFKYIPDNPKRRGSHYKTMLMMVFYPNFY